MSNQIPRGKFIASNKSLSKRALDSLLVAAIKHSAEDVAELLDAGANPNQTLEFGFPDGRFPISLATLVAHDFVKGDASEDVVRMIFSRADFVPFNHNPDVGIQYKNPLGAIFFTDMDTVGLHYPSRSKCLLPILIDAGYKLEDYSTPKCNAIALVYAHKYRFLTLFNPNDFVDTSGVKFSMIKSMYDRETLQRMVNQPIDISKITGDRVLPSEKTILGHMVSGFNDDQFDSDAYSTVRNIIYKIVALGADIHAPMLSGESIVNEVASEELKELMLTCHGAYLASGASLNMANKDVKSPSMRRI